MRDSHLDLEIIIDPDEEVVQNRLEDVLTAYRKIAKGIDEAMKQVDFSQTIAHTVRLRRHTEKFAGQLSYLRLNLGSLKAALTQAFAPIGNLILPVINKAINGLKSFLHTVGAVLAAVTEQIFGMQAVTKANDGAAKSYSRLGASAKKSLASFDQIQRLNGASGSSSSVYEPKTTLTGNMKGLANKILQLLQPILSINFAPLKAAVQNLWSAVQPLLQKLGDMLTFLWQAVAAPLIAWCVQTLFPVFTGLVTKAIEAVTNATGPLVTGLKLVWDAMQPVVEFIKNAVITSLLSWRQVFSELALQLQEKGDAIATVFYGIRDVLAKVWSAISPVLQVMKDYFSETFAGVGRVAMQVIGALMEGLAGVTEFLTGAFTGDWKRAWNGIVLFFKSIVNSLIGMLNTVLVKLTATLNAVVNLLSKLKFTVPKWVPGIGGEVFQIPMKSFQAPQIPYLAKGAVLPANKPFLAMVGDQKHGTNIEAPLATIQQAVAQTMAGFESANMAGHNATVAVLRQILEAVLGIELGDEVIAGAYRRYQSKMDVVRGGAL